VSIKVHVTRMLVRHLQMHPDLSVDAVTLGDLLDKVELEHPGFRDSVCDEAGGIRTFVSVFVNEESIRHGRDPLSFALKDGDDVYIFANVAGGAR
jgi:molybdopterin synthase sulfur carrier subunit